MNLPGSPSSLTVLAKKLPKSTSPNQKSTRTLTGSWSGLIAWMKSWTDLWSTNMPASSDKQKKFMDAAAHNPAFAKKAGVPQNVAKEFSEKSKGLKFGASAKTRPDLQKANNPKTRHGKMTLFSKGGETMDKQDIKQDKAIIK